MRSSNEEIYLSMGISKTVYDYGCTIEKSLRDRFDEVDSNAEYNQLKVVNAMQQHQVSEACLLGTTGYGYNDLGRDTLEAVYAATFHTEDALVRPQITCGTHALALALMSNLRPGDELLSPVGKPYDTLEEVIGIRPSKGSLAEYGVTYRQVDLLPDGSFDYDKIRENINEKTHLVTIQRSKGYQTRPTLSVQRIGELIAFIKGIKPDVICMVDNCYGEFVETIEPSDVGADMIVGSLIKNPGGGLAPIGGYIAGKKECVENAAYRLTSPGLGKELGVYLYMLTGGEPLVRKADILKLAEKHNDVQFAIYTNSTLIDEPFCKEVVRLGNIAFMLSIEGTPETNDARRGEGHYAAVMRAMDLLKEHGILFGTSICYTRDNIEAVTSDEFMRFLCDKGAHFGFYFHYMPVGNEAAPELMPSPEQRKYMIQRIRYLRSEACDIPFYPMDFQNDGEFVGGCIAGGRNYFHINSAGDAEPCVFIHYSNANIHDSSILEILQSPLFMAYHNGQPFNKNHLRPCPMLENPELLRKMVHETGAHSTDLQSPESVDHLCDKCKSYAANWQPTADEIWSHTKIRESRYENYKDWKPNQQ